MEELSMYFCLKLKERYKEYNKENEPVKFAKYLKILQYSKKDRDVIFKIMNENCKKRFV